MGPRRPDHILFSSKNSSQEVPPDLVSVDVVLFEIPDGREGIRGKVLVSFNPVFVPFPAKAAWI
jgi:hypothetical protein